jgi:dihydropteroate synthase
VEDLRAATVCALERQVAPDQIVVDPGLGFSKRTEVSVAVLAELERVIALGFPVLIGPSRKRFVGELAGGLAADDRLEATLGAVVAGLARGASIFRVHDVAAARRALLVADAILNA